jgi:hypothetical protein
MRNPDDDWKTVANLPGRRITRVQTTRTTWELRDESSSVVGIATRPSTRWGNLQRPTGNRRPVLQELSTGEGDFQIVLSGTWDSHTPSALALEHLAADGPVTLMQSATKRGFSKVTSSPTIPFGTINDWKLPDGSPLDAFCQGSRTPWKTICLQSAGSPVIVARYLERPQPLWALYLERSLGRGFQMGEAVLSSDLPDASSLVPLLLFTFVVLQYVNL